MIVNGVIYPELFITKRTHLGQADEEEGRGPPGTGRGREGSTLDGKIREGGVHLGQGGGGRVGSTRDIKGEGGVHLGQEGVHLRQEDEGGRGPPGTGRERVGGASWDRKIGEGGVHLGQEGRVRGPLTSSTTPTLLTFAHFVSDTLYSSTRRHSRLFLSPPSSSSSSSFSILWSSSASSLSTPEFSLRQFAEESGGGFQRRNVQNHPYI